MNSDSKPGLPASKTRILVVDDITRNLQVVGTMLRNAGYEIMPTTSGAQALERVRAQLPDLPLPSGELALRGRVNQPASVGIKLGEVDYTQSGLSVLPYLSVHKLGQAIARDLLPMALVLDTGQPGALARDPLPVSQMGPEKHLGYAVQWFGLATALLMIYVGLNTHREKKELLS